MGKRVLRVPGLVGAVGLLAVLLALALAPGRASADCGGVEEAVPHHHPAGQLPPLAIGDSTMLLALYDLSAIGYDANAHGCRQYEEALQLIAARKKEGRLPYMVVIALGADGSVTGSDIGRTLGLLCCTPHLLVLVTPRELGGGSGSDAATEHQEAAKHPGRIRLLDWVAYSAGHGSWFQPDGLHLTTTGAQAFTTLMKRALPWAYPKKRKPHRHRPA